MDTRLHDIRNNLAVAIASVHAFIDEKLTPDRDSLQSVLTALERVEAALPSLRGAATNANVVGNEAILDAIIEGSPFAKVLVDDGGRIVLVNGQTEHLFGYSRDELFGQSIELLVPARFRDGHLNRRAAFNAAPIARPMGAGRDLHGRRRDGSEISIEIGLNPIRIDKATFTLAAITDITERKNAEALRLLHAGVAEHAAQLEELNAELARVSRFKTQFVATMSHELRTPLTAIVGAAELLNTAKIDERAAGVQTITEAAQTLLSLINSVLDFSKIEAGKLELRPAVFNVATALEGSAEVVAQIARDKGVALSTYVDPEIPVVEGDPDRLRQIILNLLANGVKFTARGHVVARALLAQRSDRDVVVRFEVEDTGIGIAADALPQLFEPFTQAASTAEHVTGTGLGLSIARSLVELMGGEIGVDSTLGAGTAFWFTARFTVAAGALDAHAGVGGLIGPSDDTSPVPALGTVLVAEDNAQLQRLLKLQFDELKVPVVFVANGREALDAVRNARYALVFMDCQMPRMDGLAATRAIRAEERTRGGHIPIAAMTASAFAEDRDACIAAGMDDYLAKPVTLADLRAMIERWAPARSDGGEAGGAS